MRDSLNILIVDDDDGDRAQIKRALRQVEAECSESTSVDDALEACERKTFDCAIVDYRLGGHDGLTGIGMLHKRFPYIALVMITGQGDETVATEAMKVGAVDYLSKNRLTPESLWRSVEKAVEKQRSQRALIEREAWLSTVLHCTPNATIVTDAEGRVQFLNVIAEKLLGRTLAELAGLGWRLTGEAGGFDQDLEAFVMSMMMRRAARETLCSTSTFPYPPEGNPHE